MGDTVSDLERRNLLTSAAGALATDTISDLRLKRYKSATVGLTTVSDFEKKFIETFITNETPQDSLHGLRRKYYMQKGFLSGAGKTTDDLHLTVETTGP